MEEFKINDVIETIVTGISDYGIFVATNNNYIGMIHISEISDGFVRNINDYANVGEKIYAKILDIDKENKKLKLSIKNMDGKKSNLNLISNGESNNGFEPLGNNLEKWINEKLKELNNKNQN